MVANKCLICDADLEPFKEREIDHSSDSFLSKDLHVIFVLKNLFDIPREKVESYLAANHGNPSEWKFVSFCGHCGEAVENAKRIYLEMLDATKIFAAVKQEIVETVRRHWRRRNDSGSVSKELNSRKTGSVTTSDNLAAKIVEETRKFIHDHDYGLVMDKDPFVDGDLHAKKLCSLKLAHGSSSCHGQAKPSTSVVKKAVNSLKLRTPVKNEPMTYEDEKDFSRLYMSPNDLEVDYELKPYSLLVDDHAELNECQGVPESESHQKGQKGTVKTTRAFFKLKDFKSQRKQIHKLAPRPFMYKSSKKKYRCEFKNCGRKYESEGELVQHVMKHIENKPFHCDWPDCNWRFKSASNLRRHELLHSGRAFVYECGFCYTKFTRNDTLKAHLNRFHRATCQ